jgi:hypothetical protein
VLELAPPRTAEQDLADRGIGHLLGALDRVAHRMGGGQHIDHIAAPDALAGPVARAQHDQFARLRQPGDHRRGAERAQIDGGKDLGDAGSDHADLFLCLMGVGGGLGFCLGRGGIALLFRQFIGMAGHEHVGAIVRAHVEAGDAAQQAVDPVETGEFEQGGGGFLVAFGQGETCRS